MSSTKHLKAGEFRKHVLRHQGSDGRFPLRLLEQGAAYCQLPDDWRVRYGQELVPGSGPLLAALVIDNPDTEPWDFQVKAVTCSNPRRFREFLGSKAPHDLLGWSLGVDGQVHLVPRGGNTLFGTDVPDWLSFDLSFNPYSRAHYEPLSWIDPSKFSALGYLSRSMRCIWPFPQNWVELVKDFLGSYQDDPIFQLRCNELRVARQIEQADSRRRDISDRIAFWLKDLTYDEILSIVESCRP